jgi:hypothetical protein
VILFQTGTQQESTADFCKRDIGPSVSTKAGNFAGAMNINETLGETPIPGV